jgi:uncharacterized protein (DUF983 family)
LLELLDEAEDPPPSVGGTKFGFVTTGEMVEVLFTGLMSAWALVAVIAPTKVIIPVTAMSEINFFRIIFLS